MSASSRPSRKGMLPEASSEASYPTPASQSSTPSRQSPNTLSLPTPYSDENRALRNQVAELERAKGCLIKQVVDAEDRTAIANTRVSQAENRAAAADFETKAAIQRAQNRYTEKLHANNESRKLREAVEARDVHLRGYRVSVQSALGNQKAKIAQLEHEKMVGDGTKERGARIGILEEQLGEMERGFLSSQEEKATNKAQSDKIIQDLQAVIMRLQSPLTKEQDRMTPEDLQAQIDSAKADTTTKLESNMREIEVKFKAREQDLIRHTQVKLKNAESHWSQKEQILRDQVTLLKNQLKDVRKQAELRENRSQKAARTVQNSPQMFAVQQPQQVLLGQGFNPKKRRRVGSTSSAESSAYSLTSNHAAVTPRSLKYSEEDIPTSNAQSFPRHSATTIAKRSYGHYSSPRSNRSTGPTTPLQQLQHQQVQQCSPGFGVSLSRQTEVSLQSSQSGRMQQAFSLLSPQQQQDFFQAMNSGSTGNQPTSQAQVQNHLQNPQLLQLGFNMGVARQSHNAMVQVPSNTPTPTCTKQNNDGCSTPVIGQTRMMSGSSFNDFMGNWGISAPVNSQGYANNSWISSEDPRAANFHGSPQNGNVMLQMVGNQSHVNENQVRQQRSLNHETGAPSRPTPAPQATSTRRVLAPAEPRMLACMNCYQHWWENQCDGGEPCINCQAEGKPCKRQRCFNFAAGTCDKGSKCPCVHEGDEKYQDEEFLVEQPKAGKRPQRAGKKAEAATAPILRQRS